MEAAIQFELDAKTLSEAILIAMEGKFHPKIFRETKLLQTNNTSQKIPFPSEELAITDIIKLSAVKIVFSENELIYILDIPLVDSVAFKLLKLLQLPVAQNINKKENLFAYIPVKSQYIALSNNSKEFTLITPETLNNCKKVGKIYLCQNTEPIQTITDNSNCEIKIAAKLPVNISKCNPRITNLYDTY